MLLEEEIKNARHEIVTDGYEMSIGELMNLYRDHELIINPNFQRYFVWAETQKTRFIESIILGIPIPPIFVYQNEDGVWELVDGLQRLSTILEFAGELRTANGNIASPSILNGTKMLPSLANKTWNNFDGVESEPIGRAQQLEIKRARMRIEILKKESDPLAKFELFQRLNTGGTQLKPQEVRNVVMLMIDKDFHDWVHNLAHFEDFLETLSLSGQQVQRQMPVELALRLFVYRNVPYQSGLDVHEYIDDAVIDLARSDSFDRDSEADVFYRTFTILHEAVGADAFKRWDGERFTGMFLMSAFEIVTYGVSQNLDQVEGIQPSNRKQFIRSRIIRMWEDEKFQRNSGAGVRGTTRLRNLLPIASKYFKVD
jgi:hypothetical protein